MLKDDFYRYGIISNLLHVIIISLVVLMYLSTGLNQFGEGSFFARVHLSFVFILFFVLILKFIWRIFNKPPMSLTLTLVGGIIQKINLLFIYLLLFAMITLHFWGFIFDAYSLYEVDVNNKVNFTVFGLVVIPFSIIQLVCYMLTEYLHVDILYLKYTFQHFGNQVMIYFPLLVLLYVLQKLFNRIMYRKNKPEKLD